MGDVVEPRREFNVGELWKKAISCGMKAIGGSQLLLDCPPAIIAFTAPLGFPLTRITPERRADPQGAHRPAEKEGHSASQPTEYRRAKLQRRLTAADAKAFLCDALAVTLDCNERLMR